MEARFGRIYSESHLPPHLQHKVEYNCMGLTAIVAPLRPHTHQLGARALHDTHQEVAANRHCKLVTILVVVCEVDSAGAIVAQWVDARARGIRGQEQRPELDGWWSMLVQHHTPAALIEQLVAVQLVAPEAVHQSMGSGWAS
jgi:hypothetical protein